MTAPTPAWQTLLLDPRDPLVFGDGGRIQPVVPRSIHQLPPQATAAGLVRTRLGEGYGFSSKVASQLLEVKIRGPWLAEAKEDGSLDLWTAAPADVAVSGDELVPAERISCHSQEGVTLPEGCPAAIHFLTPPAKVNGVKTRPLNFPFWPLESVIEWGLGTDPNRLPQRDQILAMQERSPKDNLPPIVAEHRIHVAIDPESGTALAEALFNSGGQRYAEGFRVVIEVDDSAADLANAQPPADKALRVLGGEGRLVRCQARPGPTFPSFDAYRPRIEKRIRQIAGSGKELYLRLQLLTPGAFGGWLPPDQPRLHREKLAALRLPRFQAVSGWNLQAGGPRKIRRLVPPGSVYLYGPYDSHAELLAACEQLWGRSLCAGLNGDPDSFLAPPAHDGYGLVLPLPSTLPLAEAP